MPNNKKMNAKINELIEVLNKKQAVLSERIEIASKLDFAEQKDADKEKFNTIGYIKDALKTISNEPTVDFRVHLHLL